MTTNLKVSGMMCQACVGHVTKALQSVPGVQSVLVELPDSARVEHQGASDPALLAAVDEEGYNAQVVDRTVER